MNHPNEKDREILKILSKNGRISYSDLGEKVGLSPSGIRKRVKRLEEKGFIKGYKALINHKKLEKNSHAFIGIKSEKSNFNSSIFDDNRIMNIYRVSGDPPLLIEGWFKDNEDLSTFVEELKEKLKGDIQVTIVLDEKR